METIGQSAHDFLEVAILHIYSCHSQFAYVDLDSFNIESLSWRRIFWNNAKEFLSAYTNVK